MESPDWDKQPPLGEFGEKPTRSKDEFQTLEPQEKIEPSNLGEYIDRAATLYVPSMVKQMGNPKEMDILQATLSAKIACTLSLESLCKLNLRFGRVSQKTWVHKEFSTRGNLTKQNQPKP